MNCLLPRLHGLWLLVAGLAAAPAAPRDALSAVQVLREGGCGGIVPAARPLRHDPLLDQAARQWSEGRTLPAAAQSSGYLAGSTAGVHVSGPDSALLELLMRSGCGTLTSRALREIGVYRRGPDVWLVLAPVAMTAAGARAPAWSMSGIGPSVPTSAPAHARPSPPVTRSLTAPAGADCEPRATAHQRSARSRDPLRRALGRCGTARQAL